MSMIAKICAGLACVFSLASIYLGNEIIGQREEAKGQYATESSNHKATADKLTATQKTVESTQSQLKDTEGKLADAGKREEGLKTSLNDQKSKLAEMEKSVKDAASKIEAEQAKLKTLEASLDGKTPAEFKGQIKKLQGDLDSLTADKKKIEDDLAAQKAVVAELKDQKERGKTGLMPPGITGKVLTVNKAWNFVVLNVGDKEGVVENGVFVAYRDKKFLGKVKVVSTEAHTCVADIMPEMVQGALQVGDEVFN